MENSIGRFFRTVGGGAVMACDQPWLVIATVVFQMGWIAAWAGDAPPFKKSDAPPTVRDGAPSPKAAKAVRRDVTVEEVLSLDAHRPYVRFALFSKDGRRLYTGGNDNLVKSWKMPDGKLQQTLKGHAGPTCCGTLSPDGKILVTGSWDGSLRTWDAETGKLQGIFIGQSSPISSVAFSPDGKALASGGDGRTFCLWDFKTRKLTYTSPEQKLPIRTIRYSPDGELLATGTGDGDNADRAGEVKLWKAETGEELQLLAGHSTQVNGVAFSSDGKRLATGASDGNIRIWDIAQRKLVSAADVRGCVWAVEYFPDDVRLAVAQWPGQILIWNLTTARREAVAVGHEKGKMIFALAVSPDGGTLVSGSADGTARIWNVVQPE